MTVAVATNQSGIARQYYNFNTLHQMHQKMIDGQLTLAGHNALRVFCLRVNLDRLLHAHHKQEYAL